MSDTRTATKPANAGNTANTVLRCSGVVKNFGGIAATQNVSMNIPRGARHALIGPNGAGKTTLIHLISGTLKPDAGRIELLNPATQTLQDISHWSAYQRSRAGLIRSFQISQIFASMTPLQSLLLAVTQQAGQAGGWWKPLGHQADVRLDAEALLNQFGLESVALQNCATMPYGKRRLLELALALAAKPQVLLLDEPMAGVPAAERAELLHTLQNLPADLSLVLIEHDMDLVFDFAQHITVLVNGAVLTEGSPQHIAQDERVQAVYLGTGEHA